MIKNLEKVKSFDTGIRIPDAPALKAKLSVDKVREYVPPFSDNLYRAEITIAEDCRANPASHDYALREAKKFMAHCLYSDVITEINRVKTAINMGDVHIAMGILSTLETNLINSLIK